MANMNESLIRAVFDEMLRYRPALSKYTIVDEDEDDLGDYRVLGDQIIKNYPWPVGVELRRLFSASMRELNRMRLDQIFKTIERTMQFVSFVMLSQIWQDSIKNKISIPDNLKQEFGNRITVLSLGNFTWLIRILGNLYKDQNCEWFMPEICENFDKKFYAALSIVLPESFL